MKKQSGMTAFFGVDTEFEGQLTFKGTIRIDGRFKGEIAAKGDLIVGESAQIEAEIKISTIIVSGTIEGNIGADKSIEIQKSGRVRGNIEAPTVIIHEGAVLQGNCRTQKPTEGRSNSATTASPAPLRPVSLKKENGEKSA
jgi:cytoskeletal protein CcmA (bactofilin family)